MARDQALAADQQAAGQILTDQKTLGPVEDLVRAEPLGAVSLKGFARPVRAFNILGLRNPEA